MKKKKMCSAKTVFGLLPKLYCEKIKFCVARLGCIVKKKKKKGTGSWYSVLQYTEAARKVLYYRLERTWEARIISQYTKCIVRESLMARG